MARHPIGFKPSWPRLLYKPGEAVREEFDGPVADAIGAELIVPGEEASGMDSPDQD